MRTTILILFTAAYAVGVVFNNPRYVSAVAALTVFGFIIIGFLVFPRREAAFPFRMGPHQGSQKTLVISGAEVSSSDFTQHFTCVMQLRGWPLLLILALLFAAAFCLLVSNVPIEPLLAGNLVVGVELFYLLTSFSLVVAMRLYSEQTLLAKAMITIGIITQTNEWGKYRKISYQ